MCVPATIPDYELLRCVGRGAYGEVWLVRSITGTYRAAKIVYRSNFQDLRPFEREFEGIQKFEPVSRSQENQISILHIGRNDAVDYFYYVMELADDVGQDDPPPGSPAAFDPATYKPKTLREVLTRRGRLPAQDCITLAVGLSNALGHLHAHGLIHRDVKPSNIIFVNGQPKLADIGLVSSIDATRSFVGTEGYVPPEGPGTPAADIYSLGKVLYECATGRNRSEFPLLPADFESMADREAVLELNEVILKACADDRARRYASAAEMRAELLLLQAGKSVKRLHAMERRLKRLTPAIAVTALLAGAIILAQQWENGQVRERARIQTEFRARAEEQESAMRNLLYAADMNLAQRAYADGDLGRVETFLNSQIPKAGQPDLRGFEWRFLRRACQGQQQFTFTGFSNMVRRAAFSPDGRLLAGASYDQSVRVWDVASHALVASFPFDDEVSGVAFSPDGRRLLCDEFGTLLCYNLASRKLLFEITNGLEGITASSNLDLLAMSRPNSTASNTAPADRHVDLLDSRDGRLLFSLPEPGDNLSFSPDGKYLAAGTTPGHIHLWDLAAKRVITSFMCPDVDDLSFSPDGAIVALAGGDGLVRLWEPSGNQIPRLIQTPQGTVWQVAFSPDGQTLATAGSDETVRTWDAHTLAETGVFRGHRGEVIGIAFAPDGKTFATAGKDDTVRLWNINEPGRDEVLARNVDFWNWPIMSADGGLVAVGVNEGIKVWRTADNLEVIFLTNALAMRPLGFDEGGQALWTLGPAGSLRLMGLKKGQGAMRTFKMAPLDPDDVNAHAFSAKRHLVALGQKDGMLRLWDLASGTELRLWRACSSRVTSLTFSQDGDRLISTSEDDFDVKVWRIPTAELLLTLQGHKLGVFGAAFSPDESQIATASPDDTCRLWDAQTGRQTTVLNGHKSGAYAVAFAPDGKTLVVGTGDSTLRLWNLKTLRDMGVIQTETRSVFFTGFTPDGRTLATVSFDGPTLQCSLRLFRADGL
jgi:WD40 repeat protein